MSVIQEPVDALVHALNQSGFDPRPTGPGCWESCCPVHQGQRRNLSIRRAEDGRALLHCHHTAENGQATCSAQDIVGAIGLELADLYPHRDQPGSGTTTYALPNRLPGGRPRRKHQTVEAAVEFVASTMCPRPVAARSWTYTDTHGNPVMAVGRFDLRDGANTYRPFHRLPEGLWIMGAPSGLLPLYRLDEVAAVDVVLVLEGEKCAEAAR